METTLPALQIFHKESGPLHNDLKDMLYAWVVSRSDEGLGYNVGAAKVAAMLLINMPAPQGFIVMRNLLERHLLRNFFGGDRTKDEVRAIFHFSSKNERIVRLSGRGLLQVDIKIPSSNSTDLTKPLEFLTHCWQMGCQKARNLITTCRLLLISDTL